MPAAKPAAALAKPAIVLASPSAVFAGVLAPHNPIKMPPGLSPRTSTGGKKSLEMFKFGLSPVVPMPSLEKNVRETEITRVPVPSQIAFEMLKELLDEGRTSMFTRDIAGAAVTTCKEGQCALLVSTMRGEPRAPLVIKRVKRLVIYAMWNREALGAPANIDRSTRFRHLSGYQTRRLLSDRKITHVTSISSLKSKVPLGRVRKMRD